MKEIARIRSSFREEGLYKIVTLEWEEDGFPCFCDLRLPAETDIDELNMDEALYDRLEQLVRIVAPDAFDEYIDDLDTDLHCNKWHRNE